jgi:PAS domain S-box-containing protein
MGDTDMAKPELTPAFVFAAFQRAAQYLAGLLPSADLYSETVAVAQKIFLADYAAIFWLREGQTVQGPTTRPEALSPFTKTVVKTIRQVLDSGFLAMEKFTIDDSTTYCAFLPITRGGYSESLLVVCFHTDTPLPNELLEALLGVTGMVAALLSRQESDAALADLNERYRLILESSAEGIFGLDMEGKHTFVNPAAAEMLGYTVAELEGQHSHSLLHHRHPDGRPYPAQECPIHKVLVTHQGYSGEESFIRRDNSHFPVEFVSTPLFNKGKVAGAVVNFRDISQRKEAEAVMTRYHQELEQKVRERTRELNTAREAAESANRAKSTFLASMSHELRTPLNAILGFSQLMAHDAGTTEPQKEKLAIINRSGEHLLSMISDILDLSKIEVGKIELEPVSFELPQLLKDISDVFSQRANTKGLAFTLEIAPKTTSFVKADAKKLRQILINLLGNAIKFTNQGGVSLRAGTKVVGEKLLLELEVEDSGPGIPLAQQTAIFEPFFKAGSASVPGAGMGLTISRSFLELMGGYMELASTPEKGSLFHVTLPIEATTADAVQSMKAPRPRVLGLTMTEGQPEWRILVVEDDFENRQLLTIMLTQTGFQVLEAANGEIALSQFERSKPHFIWMDMYMPVMDGYEATRRIRAMPGGKEVKIVALTGSALQEQKKKILAAGCDAVVIKPFQEHEIFDTMAQYLKLHYIYEEHVDTSTSGPTEIDPEIVSSLPQELRERLRTAAIALNTKAFDAAVVSVREHHPALADDLTILEKGFRFDLIQALFTRQAGKKP